jgi:hypothetical protein
MNAIQTVHRSLTRAGRRRAAAGLAAAAVILISIWSCKSPTSPDGGEADIYVVSHWTDPVDVYMDGVFQFWLSYKNYAEIDNVSKKSHLMEARSQVTGEVVAQKTIEVTSMIDYSWTIEHLARINCANAFGETLKVTMDGVFQFVLADEEDRWIIDVALGEHLLSAFKTSDGKEVAAILVKVTENRDYSWTISMIEGGSPVAITRH